ncbi:MAG TPA: YeeE/YedE thiosulfate transporter family protein [Burkholderiales bacterium]|nr:YeeE/YedE thiosulfate transporter family protein [Burkholderiales bacterium]
MTAPLSSQGLIGDGTELAVAVGLGFLFGFFLERAGFGSSRKLAAVFYLYDMAVLKVMFTAIVTAMTGLWALSAVGWLDLGEIYLVPTFLLPQFVGGLVLGAGFVIGGYCPGTSVAGMATGRIDAMLYALGMLAGLAFYAAAFPAIEAWTKVTALGEVTWPDLLGLPRWVLVALVLAMAAAMFFGATRAEKAFAGWRPAGTT